MTRNVRLIIVLSISAVAVASYILWNRAAHQREIEGLRNRVADTEPLAIEEQNRQHNDSANALENGVELQREELTALDILNLAEKKWDTIQDYHCSTVTFTKKGDETRTQILDLVFQRPDRYRSTVIEGDYLGSAGSRDADGLLQGRMGGVLSAIVVTLDPNDDRVRSIRGKAFYETSWGVEIQETHDAIEDGWALERLADEELDATMCYVIAVNADVEKSEVTQQQVWVDQQTHLLRRRIDYEGELLVRDSKYIKVELNVGPEPSVFRLK